MAQIIIQCACGQRGTYHRVWVQGSRLFSEDTVIVWYDPRTKDDPKVSIQRNTGHSVYKCLNCAFDAEKRDREAEEARKLEKMKLKAEKTLKKAGVFHRLLGR